MTKITTTLLSLLLSSLLTNISSSPSLTSLPSRILPRHIMGKKHINHKDRRREHLAKEDVENKLLSRHYSEPHERNAPNPRKRPYYTRSPSASPSVTPPSTPTVTPLCKLDDNGEFGTIETNISTIIVPIEYAYEMNVKDDRSDKDIQDMISKIEMKLGTYVVASLWDECPDISMEVDSNENDKISRKFMLRKLEERNGETESSTDNINVDTSTIMNEETFSNVQNIVMGLSIEPQDELSENACRELTIEDTTILMNCYRVDGEITLYTRQISPRQTTNLTNHITEVLKDTFSNSNFLDDIDEEIEEILSTDHDYMTQPPIQVINSLEESSKRKDSANTTWILTSSGAVGAVVIAAAIKFKRRQWLTKRDSATDDGSFSLSSYGSWFRKRGGNMHVDSEGNVETEVVV